VSVCLSTRISPEPHARFLLPFFSFFVHVAYGCGPVLLRQSDKVPKWKGVSFPIDNTLYSIALGTHTKTAELIS